VVLLNVRGAEPRQLANQKTTPLDRNFVGVEAYRLPRECVARPPTGLRWPQAALMLQIPA
jgi:hypothetical protein